MDSIFEAQRLDRVHEAGPRVRRSKPEFDEVDPCRRIAENPSLRHGTFHRLSEVSVHLSHGRHLVRLALGDQPRLDVIDGDVGERPAGPSWFDVVAVVRPPRSRGGWSPGSLLRRKVVLLEPCTELQTSAGHVSCATHADLSEAFLAVRDSILEGVARGRLRPAIEPLPPRLVGGRSVAVQPRPYARRRLGLSVRARKVTGPGADRA